MIKFSLCIAGSIRTRPCRQIYVQTPSHLSLADVNVQGWDDVKSNKPGKCLLLLWDLQSTGRRRFIHMDKDSEQRSSNSVIFFFIPSKSMWTLGKCGKEPHQIYSAECLESFSFWYFKLLSFVFPLERKQIETFLTVSKEAWCNLLFSLLTNEYCNSYYSPVGK